MTNSQHLVALELIVNVFEKKYNYTLINATDMEYDYMMDLVRAIDSTLSDALLLEIERFRINVPDDASVYLLRTNTELCGIMYVQDD